MRVVHVPTPGDHYSPSTGSAVMTVIDALNRRHVARGGEAAVVVTPGTRRDYGSADVIEVPLEPIVDRRQKAIDSGLGAIIARRPFSARAYRSLQSIDLTDSRLVVHNAAGPILSLARRLPEAAICLYSHNELFRAFTRNEARRTVHACYRVICVSDFIAKRLRAKVGGRPTNIEVVHNGVDTEFFHPAERHDDSRPPVVLFVGRVLPQKGVHLLIRAAVEVRERGRDFRLRIVGSSGFSDTGPLSAYEQELRLLAAPLEGCVEFVPFTDRRQIAKQFQDASIFVVPSDWDDPCPLTLGEGMANGLPTIASHRGGIPELGADAVLWFDPPGIPTLVDHMIRLLDRPEERRRYGGLARARAERLSWDIQYERFLEAIK